VSRAGRGGHPDRCNRAESFGLIVYIVPIGFRGSDMVREIAKGGGENLRLNLPELAPSGKAGRDLQTYLDGWSIVDVDEHGRRIDPSIAARLYESLEGRRMVHASRGFLDPPRAAHCPRCGGVGYLHALPIPPAPPAALPLALVRAIGPP
jgi:hypothetical protein